jgi:hypothetical protein
MADETPNTNLAKLDVLISRLLADENSGNLRTISTVHEKIHKGEIYVFGHYDTSVANNGNLDILFKTGASLRSDIIVNIASTGDAEVRIYEAPTTSGDGTPLTPRNKNRYTTDTVTFSVFHTPTVDVVGTELINQFVAGGSGGIKIGASTEERDEWVFKHGVNYLLRATNISGLSAKINVVASVYEASNI